MTNIVTGRAGKQLLGGYTSAVAAALFDNSYDFNDVDAFQAPLAQNAGDFTGECAASGYARVDVAWGFVRHGGYTMLEGPDTTVVFPGVAAGFTPTWLVILGGSNPTDPGNDADNYALCVIELDGSVATDGGDYTITLVSAVTGGKSFISIQPQVNTGSQGWYIGGPLAVLSDQTDWELALMKTDYDGAISLSSDGLSEVEAYEIDVSGYVRKSVTPNSASYDPTAYNLNSGLGRTTTINWAAASMAAGEDIGSLVLLLGSPLVPVAYYPCAAPIPTEDGLSLVWEDDGTIDSPIFETVLFRA